MTATIPFWDSSMFTHPKWCDFTPKKKTTIVLVILSYIVFNVKMVVSNSMRYDGFYNSVSMFKTSCADLLVLRWIMHWISKVLALAWWRKRRLLWWIGHIVFQNMVVDLQRGDEIYGYLWWIVAWAPSFTTGWSAPCGKMSRSKRLKQPSLLGVHGPHPDEGWVGFPSQLSSTQVPSRAF